MKQKIGILFLIAATLTTGWYLLKDDAQLSPPDTATESLEIQKEPNPEVSTEPDFDKSKFSNADVTSIWVVVNKQRPLSPQSYAPNDLVAVGGGQQLRSEAAQAFSNMITEAKKAGLSVSPLSGYRSYTTQVRVYNNEVATNGQAVADTQSARPGTSEHQTGLGLDVGGGGCGIEDCFANTAEGKWVAANGHKYGFIIRYPEGKQSITGYRYEPWHIRYVGVELATEMQKQGVLTLEEFFGLPAAPNY
jgi:D-alanyl-D-alanine carboxypeptidase